MTSNVKCDIFAITVALLPDLLAEVTLCNERALRMLLDDRSVAQLEFG
jgi:hypothetical protein